MSLFHLVLNQTLFASVFTVYDIIISIVYYYNNDNDNTKTI